MTSIVKLKEIIKNNFTKDSLFLAIKKIIPYLLAILIILTSGYAKVTTRQGAFNSTVLFVLLAVAIVFAVTFIIMLPKDFLSCIVHPIRSRLFKKKGLYLFLLTVVLTISFFVLYYIKGNEITTLAHYLLLIVFGFCFAAVVPFKKFVKYFNNTFLFVSIFSIIMYFFAIVSKELNLFTSLFTNKNGIVYYSYLDLFFYVNNGVPRNYGPFWEPGIFSLLLLLCIMFEFLFTRKPRWFYIAIYGLTLITTFSTSGIVLAVLAIPLYFTKSSNNKGLFFSLIIILAAIGVFLFLGQPSFNIPFFSTVFSKLFASAGLISFTTRLLSPVYGLYLGATSYGTGYGPNIFDNYYENLRLFGALEPIAQTSTLGWMSGSFGIIGFAFCIASVVLIYLYLKSLINAKTAFIVIIIIIFVINCEPMYAFSIFWIMFMYPISWSFKKAFFQQKHVDTLGTSISNSNSGVKLTVANLSWSLIIKILALIIGLGLYPLYIKYFGNKTVIDTFDGGSTTYGTVGLGAWLVILQILSWILTFDIGIGNGLKNKVVEAINQERRLDLKKYISCSYISNLVIIVLLLCIGLPILFSIDFNELLKVPAEVVSPNILKTAFALAFVSICIEFFLKIVLNIYQALQMQVIASVTPLISTILLLLFVFTVKLENVNDALLAISGYYIFSVNFPLLVLTIILFSKRFKDCKPSFKEWSFSYAKSVITLGGIYFLIQIFLLVINSTNKVIISNVYGASLVADYEPYSKLFSAICGVGSAISLPIWTLTIRADVKKDYVWMKKMEKTMAIISGLFAVASLFAAAVLQIVFNVWLKEETIVVNYYKAFAFAIWSSATICSYFVTAFSNGFKILKPQIIVFGIGAILKVPVFMLVRIIIPSVDWTALILIDSIIMILNVAICGSINHAVIKRKIDSSSFRIMSI